MVTVVSGDHNEQYLYCIKEFGMIIGRIMSIISARIITTFNTVREEIGLLDLWLAFHTVLDRNSGDDRQQSREYPPLDHGDRTMPSAKSERQQLTRRRANARKTPTRNHRALLYRPIFGGSC